MANFNKIIFLGRLARDVQLKFLPSGTSIAEFGLAANHKYKTASGEQREEVCFVDCSAFGRVGEVVNQYCAKGDSLLIEGRLKLDSWEDKNGGGKRSKHTIAVESVQLLGGKTSGDGAGARPPAAKSQSLRDRERPPVEQPFGEEQAFKDDEIPF